MNAFEFFWEVAMMSPQAGGTHLELGVEGQGMRALSQILGAGVGGSVHYGRNGLKFGTLLYPDYHSLKLTIYFALSGSLSLWCQNWVGNKRNIRSL